MGRIHVARISYESRARASIHGTEGQIGDRREMGAVWVPFRCTPTAIDGETFLDLMPPTS